MPAALSLHWNAEQLWQQLEPLLPGVSVEILPVAASTNTSLLDRARVVQQSQVDAGNVLVRRSVESGAFGRRAADLQPALLVAEHQTAGRGRQGRNWESAVGASLTFSLGLPMAVSDWAGLSLAVGVALSEAIDAAADAAPTATVGIKWPNDLWLVASPPQPGRKLGGVLIETVAAGPQRFVVVGVGINVQPFRAEGLATGFASAQELIAGITSPALLAAVIVPLVTALQQFAADGFRAFADRFAMRDVLRGRAVRSVRGEAIEGVAAGVSEFGALLLQTETGLETVASGEVTVRPVAGLDG